MIFFLCINRKLLRVNLFSTISFPHRTLFCFGVSSIKCLPTDDVLMRKIPVIISHFKFCLSALETIDHIFTKSPFVVAVWTSLGSLFEVHLNLSATFVVLFEMPRVCIFHPKFCLYGLLVLFLLYILSGLHAIALLFRILLLEFLW